MEGAVLRSHSDEHSTSDLAKSKSCFDVPGVKRILNSYLLGLVSSDQVLEAPLDFVELLVERKVTGRLDRPESEDGARPVIVIDDPETCGLATGVDAKNPH